MSTSMSLILLATAFLRFVRGQNCDGCADSTQACHQFDGGAINSKYVGCYGNFSNGVSGLSDLCGVGFTLPDVEYAVELGFTVEMCDEIPVDEIFFFAESGAGAICNSDIGTSFTIGIWGCSGDTTLTFWGTPCSRDDSCKNITDLACHGSDLFINGTLILDTGSNGNEFNTLSLKDSTYGGAICIREPSLAHIQKKQKTTKAIK